MPMMLTLEYMPATLDKKQTLPGSFYGHPIRTASKCGHTIHPSNSTHVPWCPRCALSRARARSDAALKKLASQGGLKPPEPMRNQRWNKARKGYFIAKQRFEKTRRVDQLRWEREQLWDDAHRRSDPRSAQAAVLSQSPSLCTICDSMSASYPASVPEAQAAAYNVAWWEKAVAAPITPRPLESSTPPQPPPRPAACTTQHWRPPAEPQQGNPELLQIINHHRHQMLQQNALREAWNARNKTEAAVRRKHGLGPDFEIAAAFWDWPIPGFFSWRNYRSIQEQGRMAERRARGNTTRPRPPRSSLSYSESSEQVQVEPEFIETLKQREEREELERQTAKVAGQVGYLYFVGGGSSVNGLGIWHDDVERSDKNLVVRMRRSPSDTSGSEDSQDTDDDDDDPDWMDIDVP
ncbi:hypothetical protein GGP41_000525 [Bipolaris sorokiniana]|uniref:Uncharacterized protein n=2 Tax=Cochliobolus sativus TaxID=45130 RepID=A0A8H6DXP5_COCSA|nr:uncharacterized protein COCSADRAFT_41534 [Bipolaris sorokiniana ND90Pr]EMD58979.1 hypothetical protein COCSADRAFT_41534 [Bipolaris sorokiniana ND90Pr]KAF5851729.1 hypothetical protein GGP41_000525 [Bipolaris sorokiniana]